MTKTRILALDYGEARIGLALSDETKKIALPFKTIQAHKNPKITAESIQTAVKDYKIEKIVMGLPLLLNGKDSPMSQKVRLFAEKLREITGLEVILFDERLTSSYAEKEMKEMDYSRKKRSEKVDTSAATIILQNYLESSSRMK
jgi:putative Holliday junction resolvase